VSLSGLQPTIFLWILVPLVPSFTACTKIIGEITCFLLFACYYFCQYLIVTVQLSEESSFSAIWLFNCGIYSLFNVFWFASFSPSQDGPICLLITSAQVMWHRMIAKSWGGCGLCSERSVYSSLQCSIFSAPWLILKYYSQAPKDVNFGTIIFSIQLFDFWILLFCPFWKF